MNRLDVLFLRLGGNEKDVNDAALPEDLIEEEEEQEEAVDKTAETQDFEDVFEELNYFELA